MQSLWTKIAGRPRFPTLEGDAHADVLIIGGGIAGILCAHRLHRAGIPYILVEADEICSGTTENTTAKLTYQHGLLYDRIIRRYGMDAARLYFDAQCAAMQELRALCQATDCDFSERDAFVYSLHDRQKIECEAEALFRLGADATVCERTELPFPVAAALRVPGQGCFHPLKLLLSLAADLNIYEHTRALAWEGDRIRTEHGSIRAKKIVVATHFPIFNKHGAYFLKMYQHRSYVLALQNAPVPKGMYVDESDTGLSFRPHGDLLLLGGGSHRTGKSGGGWEELSRFAKEYYPEAETIAHWATQDCMTLDGMPYIGQYSRSTPNMYVTTGFNKWGMSSAMVAAMILSDMLRGKESLYAPVFSPQRSILHPRLATHIGDTLLGMLRPTAPRCPHLGCALRYNHAEHSWDCACHGSRFCKDGRLLDGPANGDLKE
ncbi:MAG: FAD-dependent oxidoreductase [Clostridia bacterium]|nr:FAD-dependent oxidoreductase [Clostridia bacterium]